MASRRPCAAVALIYALHESTNNQKGKLFLEQVPSSETVAFLLEHNVDPIDLSTPPLTYLLEAGAPYIEIQWVARRIDAATLILTVSAQIVDRFGLPLTPAHPVEKPTQLLLQHAAARILEPSDARSGSRLAES